MATVSGALKDSDIKGKPRDLMGVIFDISPTDTPFLTLCGKSKASQTLHEWQTDKLRSPGANKKPEGNTISTFVETTTTELQNRTQILETAIKVTGTAQAVNQAGVSKQYAYQMAQRTKELKKDLELALLSNQIEASGETRAMRGLPCWLQNTANISLGTSGAAATSSAACTAGTARNTAESLIVPVLTGIYNNGGDPTTIMCAPNIRVKLSEVLTGGGTKYKETKDKTVTATVDVYVSDFGDLKIVPNRVQAFESYSKACAFILDPTYWKVAYLRGFSEQKLAVTGDNMSGFINVECTLEARNADSSGMVADLQ